MNVILLEKIKKLGNIGDEVSVKSGYARNFLVPNNKALYATPDNRKYFEEQKVDIQTKNEILIKDAQNKLKKLSELEVILIRAASDTGQLFGSVSTKDIVNGLTEKNISISKNEIDLNKSIKNLTYEKVTINLHPEVSCEITLNVARSLEEASIQKQIGKAITSNTEIEEDKKNVAQETLKNKELIKEEKKEEITNADDLTKKDNNLKTSEELNKNNEVDTSELKNKA